MRSHFPREVRNREFAAGGAGPSHSTQLSLRTRPRAPVAAHKRWPLGLTVGQRRRGQRRPKWPPQIFWRGAVAPGGLRLPPSTSGPWKRPKKHDITINQQSATCGSGRDLRGAIEVAPYGPGRNFIGAAASGCRKLPPPPLLGKKKAIKAQTTISLWDRPLGSPQDHAGGHRNDPYALFLALAGWQRRAASGRHPALQGDQKALENTQTTINYQ